MSENPISKGPIHAGAHRLLPCALASVGIDIHLANPQVMFGVDVAIFWGIHGILRNWSTELLDTLSGAIVGYFFLGPTFLGPILAVIFGAPAGLFLGAIIQGVIDGISNSPQK